MAIPRAQAQPGRLRVLVIDDEPVAGSLLADCLEDMACVVESARSRADAIEMLARERYDLVFLDLVLGQDNGLDLLKELMADDPDLWVVLLTGHAAIGTAVEAIRRGARDYIAKPFTAGDIRHVVTQALEHRRLSQRVQELEGLLRNEVPGVDLETDSPAMRTALAAVGKAATSDVTVLLRGDSGTGKGVLARAIHDNSRRSGRPFVTVNCPTLSEELLASELFGHTKGAFTGATRDQPGRVEAAQGGTLFLDEISEIRPALQAKLLRFLQDREFERIGDARTRFADVRLVAATNRDLEAAVHAGTFREDLYYRLSVVEVTVPSLRHRREDILPLARRFLTFFAEATRKRVTDIDVAAARVLEQYDWPGNVRELRNAIERAVVFASGPIIRRDDLPGRISGDDSSGVVPAASALPRLGGNCTLAAIEQAHIDRVLQRTTSLEEAARVLGIDPSTLYRKRRRRES